MGMGMGMDDVMTIILGIEDPCEPGMHGPLKEKGPSDDAVGLVTKIRDMCDEWLRSCDKGDAPEPAEEDSVEVAEEE